MTSAPFIPAGVVPDNGDAMWEWNGSDPEAFISPGTYPHLLVLSLVCDLN